MIAVQYPEPAFRLKEEAGRRLVFDGLRRSWVALTPEEWVRQNFLQYLLQVVHYPAAMIAVEKEIRLNDLRKRFDVLVYDQGHQPWLLVECKAPEVPLTPSVLDQALRYNITVPVPYLIITNGRETMGWQKQDGDLVELTAVPQWGGGISA